MIEVLKVYEQFVTEEIQLCRRIETLDIIQSYILLTVHKHGPELDTLTVEDVFMSIIPEDPKASKPEFRKCIRKRQ